MGSGEGLSTAEVVSTRVVSKVPGPGVVARALEMLADMEAVLEELSSSLVYAGSGDLGALMSRLGRLGVAVDAAEIAVAAEAFERGEPASSSPPLTPAGWVQSRSPRYELSGAARVAKVAGQCTARAIKHEGHEAFAQAVTTGVISVVGAGAVMGQMSRLEPLLVTEAVPATWEAFVSAATVTPASGIVAFRERYLARFGGAEALERPAVRARQAVHLSRPRVAGDGLSDYLLTLDAESVAVLEAALGPVSAPRPDAETGDPDLRPAGRRRAEALVELVSAGVGGCEAGQARAAHLFLTIPAADLLPAPSLGGNREAGTTQEAGESGVGGLGAGESGVGGLGMGEPGVTGFMGAAEGLRVFDQCRCAAGATSATDEAVFEDLVAEYYRQQAVTDGDLWGLADEIDLAEWERERSHYLALWEDRPFTPPPDHFPKAPALSAAGAPDVPDVPAWDGTRAGAGTVIGSIVEGSVLPVSAVQKLACDAFVTPVITFANGAPMTLGRTVRLFTPAQFRALMLRDRGCTFPGCDAPSTWTKAHHLIHWTDGGTSDLDNAALLCQRHHTVVHAQRYRGWLERNQDGPRIRWDTLPGSYDRALPARE